MQNAENKTKNIAVRYNKLFLEKIKTAAKTTVSFGRGEGLGLACRLGQRFCFAEVSTGDPRPSARGFGVHLEV